MSIFESIVATSGISTLVITGLVFLAKHWFLTRLEQSIKYEYQAKSDRLVDELRRKTDLELSKVSSELSKEIELFKLKLGPYSEMQFQTYNKIWRYLCKLKYAMLRLWEGLTEEGFAEFSELLETVTIELEESALLFREDHFHEMIRIINHFDNYKMGKKTLKYYRTSGIKPDPEIIDNLIQNNKALKDALLQQIGIAMRWMREQLSNESSTEQSNAAEH